MWLRLRQICLVAADIDKVTADLEAVFGLEVCHIDPNVGKYGLENRLLPIGNQLLEIVSPIEENTAAGRYLERRKGDGGYMVITQCDDHAPRKRRVAELGVRVANALQHDDGFHGMQLHPRDTGGSFFEIDYQEGGEAPDGAWHPAGENWQAARRTDVIDAILSAELQSPDPEALAKRWSDIAQIPLTRDADDTPRMALENASVRFVPATDGRGEGLGAIEVRAVAAPAAIARATQRGCLVERNTIVVGGTRFRLVEA